MKADWQTFALYLNQTPAASPDPIFNKPLGFYLFSLPVYDLLSGWLITLAFFILCATIVYSLLAMPQGGPKAPGRSSAKSFCGDLDSAGGLPDFPGLADLSLALSLSLARPSNFLWCHFCRG